MEFRDLKTLVDLRKVVELEKLVWGFEGEDVVPIPLFVITIKRGGILIGAFDDWKSLTLKKNTGLSPKAKLSLQNNNKSIS